SSSILRLHGCRVSNDQVRAIRPSETFGEGDQGIADNRVVIALLMSWVRSNEQLRDFMHVGQVERGDQVLRPEVTMPKALTLEGVYRIVGVATCGLVVTRDEPQRVQVHRWLMVEPHVGAHTKDVDESGDVSCRFEAEAVLRRGRIRLPAGGQEENVAV